MRKFESDNCSFASFFLAAKFAFTHLILPFSLNYSTVFFDDRALKALPTSFLTVYIKVSNFNQSEARERCFPTSNWLKFGTLPQNYRTP